MRWWNQLDDKVKNLKNSVEASRETLMAYIRLLNIVLFVADFELAAVQEDKNSIVAFEKKKMIIDAVHQRKSLPPDSYDILNTSVRTSILFVGESVWLNTRIPQRLVFGSPMANTSLITSLSILMNDSIPTETAEQTMSP